MKKISKILVLFVLSLIVSVSSAHADGSIFDNITNFFHQAFGGGSQPQEEQDLETQAAPSPIPLPSPSPDPLASCQKYLSMVYDPSMVTGQQNTATLYLNGLLDFTSDGDLDAKISADEIAQRNNCVTIAIAAGADVNSNGESKDDPYGTDVDSPVPLARAVNDNDEPAVKALLDNKANPNSQDTSMGQPIPLLQSSLAHASQQVSIDLINAGADISNPNILWVAAGEAADQVVALLIQSGKIPANQVDKLSDLPDDPGETALDPSERGVAALKAYQAKFPSGSKASVQDKITAVNRILYYIYPLTPQLQSTSVDPDAFVAELLARQQNVSNTLKAAGWSCKASDCGVVDLDLSSGEDQ